MVTRRVPGPFYVSCPHCPAKYGPLSRITTGAWKCSRCGRSFTIR